MRDRHAHRGGNRARRAKQRSSLFYALLLKDAGCSSNAAELSALFGADDFELKRDRKLTNHLRPFDGAALHGCATRRIRRLGGDRPQRRRGRSRAMTELRCDRGAEITA